MALRIPRRQKKRYSLVLWLVVIVLVVFVAGRKLGDSGSPSVIVSDYDVHDVFSRLWRKSSRPKDKTVPYFRTDAATRPGWRRFDRGKTLHHRKHAPQGGREPSAIEFGTGFLR